jgi:hypothetical protein
MVAVQVPDCVPFDELADHVPLPDPFDALTVPDADPWWNVTATLPLAGS